MTSPPSFANQDQPSILQVSPNTNFIFFTPPLYRSQQFSYDHTNTSCNVSLKFRFNSPQCQTNDNTLVSEEDFSTSSVPHVAASTIFESDFVRRTSAEIGESSANMNYGTAKKPNSLNFQFNSSDRHTNVNPTACSDNVSTPLDPDVVCSIFFDSEFVQSTPAEIIKSSAEILSSSAILGCGTAKTPDNYCKRKFSSLVHDHASPDHENASSSHNQCNKPCPVVGQVFSSYELVVQSYYDFASVTGFSVRLGSTKNVIDNESGQKILVMKRLLCSKQGSPSLILQPINGNRRKNGVSRCGCLASIKFKRLDISDNWVTDTVNFDHNHSFTTPSKIRYLPINRSISHTSKLLFSSLADVNVPVSQQAAYFSNQLGGVQNMGCMKIDINNMVRDHRIDLKNYDVDLIVEEFEIKNLENNHFFYDLVKDDQGRLKHLFWADPTMIENYKLFGDSVTFDTTNKTNVYSMVFRMFCGVNYHRKTTIFGSAFLRYFFFTFLFKFLLSFTLYHLLLH
ncbi:hypothetical protein ZOSMA_99G00410 [Zostera marina]|uniref:FAR1 domain-containing protein n=1 Tax=Zostera marina TaxID=29655 RepID=A0A0K9NJI4_ZOSMR|nr:hypothetical protein ZOSMA_99G00410 [Zostera marina]